MDGTSQDETSVGHSMARRRFLAQVTATGASAGYAAALPALAAEDTAPAAPPASPSARISIAETLARQGVNVICVSKSAESCGAAAAAITAIWSGRAALSQEAVQAVREDW